MKISNILTTLFLTLAIFLFWPQASQATPLGTAFTYQGHLYDSNYAANGLYDFQFKLYNDPNTGMQQGSTIDINDLDVVDGYFTVELDFGSSVFDGNERWLEIGVRPGELGDPNTYTALAPRQKVTPTPYALKTRGIFVDNAGNVGIGKMPGNYALDVQGNVNATAYYGSGANLTGISKANLGIDSGSGTFAGGTFVPVSFNFTFAAPPIVVISFYATTGQSDPTAEVASGSITTTGFTAHTREVEPYTFNWIAIGTKQ